MAAKQGQNTKTPEEMNREHQEEMAKIRKGQEDYKTALSDDATLLRQSRLLKELRMKDLEEGGKAADKIFTPGIMGRMGSSVDAKAVLDQRRANMQGFNPQELQAMRQENVSEIKRNNMGAQRDLIRSQGRSKVFGATAAAQQGALQKGLQGQLADQERKLFLDNISAKRQGLSDFEKSNTEKEQFNIGQSNKELQGKLSTQLGYAGLGTTERGSVMGNILGEKQLKANLAASGGGKK